MFFRNGLDARCREAYRSCRAFAGAVAVEGSGAVELFSGKFHGVTMKDGDLTEKNRDLNGYDDRMGNDSCGIMAHVAHEE